MLRRDVRAAVDRCHRDGSLKNEVASNPGKYIHAVGSCRRRRHQCTLPAASERLGIAPGVAWRALHSRPAQPEPGRRAQDSTLRPMLAMLRQSGKKLFVATNSLWDYTSVVMNVRTPAQLLSGSSLALEARRPWRLP